MLIEEPLRLSDKPMPAKAAALLEQGRALAKSVYCFDFVPSDYELVWRALGALPTSRFCEWGSGLGIVTGLAEILGFTARGIEIDSQLADISRRLLAGLEVKSTIEVGDYLKADFRADVYFVYCWPGKVEATEVHFDAIAPAAARLLICYGQSDIRCKVRRNDADRLQ